MSDVVFFIALPYVSVALALFMGLYRYSTDKFSYSSFSSQFLESTTLFWGSVPWHYGITTILLAHILAFLFPESWGYLIADSTRLYVLEVTGLALALVTILGLVLLILRRFTNPKILVVTTWLDWALLGSLLIQVCLGFWVAFRYRWGSDWYLHTAVPWLWSLVKFNPRTEYVTSLPAVVKFHIIWGFFILALFPFTRLVHIVTVPFWYLWRPYQVVIWNKRARGTSGS